MKEILDELGGYDLEYRGPMVFDGGLETTSYWLVNRANFDKPLPEPPTVVMYDLVLSFPVKKLMLWLDSRVLGFSNCYK